MTSQAPQNKPVKFDLNFIVYSRLQQHKKHLGYDYSYRMIHAEFGCVYT